MSWDDSITGSTARPTPPDRRAYVPPFLRNNIGFTVTTTFEKSKQYRSATDHRFDRSERGRLGSNRGRGRGGRGRGRSSAPHRQFHELNTPLEANPFEIAERFDELEVTENNEIELGINFDAYEDIPVETSGSNVPPPVNSFTEIDLGKAVNDNVKRCKYVKPMPIQRHAIPIAMAGRDLMACAQTGSGKTAAFCFPIISGVMRGQSAPPVWSRGPRVASPVALILSPTRELSCQIHEEAKKFAYQTGVKVVVVYGGAPISQQRLASDFLSDYIFLAVGRVGSSTDLIVQRVEFIQDMDKRNHLMNLLHTQTVNGAHGKHALTLVFVETKKGADALEHWLCMNGFPATAIHGDKVQMERERALKSFKSGVTPVLVATDVAARGLDIPHVAHVINFDLPKDIDDYVHRIGRTGRAGKSGLATAFFNDKNTSLAKALLELMQEAKQEIPPWLTQCAETSSAWGSSGRGRRYGSSRFGGRDFRSNSQFNSGDYYSRPYADAVADSYTATSSAFTCDTPETTNYAADGVDSNAAGSHGYAFDHEGIVASGWD
ncbi:DEAD-box ATP-dependent RNA helicase 37-like isoform X2 [Actinidia eriantha]|uniref:DEAD-box ATP-dependent RNA helicase 37-like isoform X2 n=1 Tax=Actinidia eriantha TaxID=165200 RepID=UPI002585C592|nr:DEAD-box ATP-dependent RNA helicase 37-like isoform X2 [Actinidia eriantha]